MFFFVCYFGRYDVVFGLCVNVVSPCALFAVLRCGRLIICNIMSSFVLFKVLWCGRRVIQVIVIFSCYLKHYEQFSLLFSVL